VPRHFLRVLERAAVGEIGGNAGGAKRVATDFGRDAGRPGRARSLQELAKRDGMGMAGSIDREAAAATP